MEEQLAELTGQMAARQSSSSMTNTMLAEFFDYISIPRMIIIHAGFLTC